MKIDVRIFGAAVILTTHPSLPTSRLFSQAESAKAQRIYGLAHRCMLETDAWDVALEGMKVVTRLSPDFQPAYLDLAQIYGARNDGVLAADALEHASKLERDPIRRQSLDATAAKLRTALPMIETKSDSIIAAKVRLGDHSGALAESIQAQEAGKADAQAYLVTAAFLLSSEQPAKALAQYDEALKRASSAEKSRVEELRAVCAKAVEIDSRRRNASKLMATGQAAEALPEWQAVVLSGFVSRADLLNYADCAETAREYSAAAAVIERRGRSKDSTIAEIAHDLASRLKNRAILATRAKSAAAAAAQSVTVNPNLAAQKYLEALQLDPGNVKFLAGVGSVFNRLRRFDEAVDAYRLAFELSDGDTALAEGVNVLQHAGFQADADHEATKLMTSAIAKGTPGLIELADAYYDASAFARVADVLSAVPAASATPRSKRLRALCLYKSDQFEAAERAFREAIAASVDDGENYADLAGALLKLKRKPEAKLMAVEAIKRGIKTHWVYKELTGG